VATTSMSHSGKAKMLLTILHNRHRSSKQHEQTDGVLGGRRDVCKQRVSRAD
jgi:hypothetical protein